MSKSWAQGNKAAPYQPRSKDVEAALFLATVARRYANGRANSMEVHDAWRQFLTEAAQKNAERLSNDAR
jgi:hypothetical protein